MRDTVFAYLAFGFTEQNTKDEENENDYYGQCEYHYSLFRLLVQIYEIC